MKYCVIVKEFYSWKGLYRVEIGWNKLKNEDQLFGHSPKTVLLYLFAYIKIYNYQRLCVTAHFVAPAQFVAGDKLCLRWRHPKGLSFLWCWTSTWSQYCNSVSNTTVIGLLHQGTYYVHCNSLWLSLSLG